MKQEKSYNAFVNLPERESQPRSTFQSIERDGTMSSLHVITNTQGEEELSSSISTENLQQM